MIRGPDFVSLQVHDIETSARFYTDVLGLRRAPQAPPGAVVFATEPTAFALREATVDLDLVDQLGWGVALWLKANDPDGVHTALVASGAQIVTEPFDGPFGRTFAFADPAGSVLTIHG